MGQNHKEGGLKGVVLRKLEGGRKESYRGSREGIRKRKYIMQASLSPLLQGWLNEEQSHLLMNDELDEYEGAVSNTRTLVWNVEDLTNPRHTGSFFSTERAIDHNLYIRSANTRTSQTPIDNKIEVAYQHFTDLLLLQG